MSSRKWSRLLALSISKETFSTASIFKGLSQIKNEKRKYFQIIFRQLVLK
jgi:hypothetical protein